MKRHWKYLLAVPALAALAGLDYGTGIADDDEQPGTKLDRPGTKLDRQIDKHARRTLAEGRQIFRFDTYGDESFWGDTIKLHQAIQGTRFGGVGPGVSPKTALAVGLKVDVDALPHELVKRERPGRFG